jgi:hypothetical protein
MAEKVQKVGVDRVTGFLYYIDKQGDVSRAKMARGGKKGGKPEKVQKVGIRRKPATSTTSTRRATSPAPRW